MNSKFYITCMVFWAAGCAVVVGGGLLRGSLQNPGFEEGFASWQGVERSGNEVAIATRAGRGGGHCLRISMRETSTTLPGIHQRLIGLEPGATYRFSSWVRGVKGGEGTSVKLKLDFYNKQGENTSIHPAVMAVEGKGPWRSFAVTAVAEMDAVMADAVVSVTGAGMADIDDVHFEKIAERPALRVSSSTPLGMDPDRREMIQLKAFFKKPYRKGGVPSFEMKIDGTRVAERIEVFRIDERSFSLNALLPPLAPGAHYIIFSSGAKEAAEAIRVEVSPRSRKPAFLGDSGEHRRGDKLFFPIGIYNVTHSEEEYAALAAHGFNMIQGKFPGDLDEFMNSLDLALRYRLAVDVPLYAERRAEKNLPRSLELFRRAGSHPAVLCWKIFDEPDADQNIAIREELPRTYAALKAANPRQPLELTLCQEDAFAYWTRFCDNVQVDRYPIPGGSVSEVYDACVKAKQLMQPWQNLTFVVQCGWTSDLKTQPSVVQARAMVYLALIAGARGISWYSKRETNWDLTTTPLWPRLAEINSEIRTLAKPLLLGKETVVHSNNSKIRLCSRIFAGKLYLLICNQEEVGNNVVLTLPEPPVNTKWGTAAAMGSPDRKWLVENGTVALTLEPLESLTVLLDWTGDALPSARKGEEL